MPADLKKVFIGKLLGTGNHFPWGVLIGVVLIFITILYPDLLITQHHYKVGDIVNTDIKAPKDFYYKDQKTTEKNRLQAQAAVLTVYDYDKNMVDLIANNVHLAFQSVRDVFTTATKIPPASASPATKTATPKGNTQALEDQKKSLTNHIWEMKPVFEGALGLEVNDALYRVLAAEKFSDSLEHAIISILKKILKNGVVANKEILLRETEKGIVLRTIGTTSEKVVTDLKKYYGPDQAKSMVSVNASSVLKDVDYARRSLIIDITQRLIQPNISLNRNETQQRKITAANQVKPFLYQVKAGEMLLREGEKVTAENLLKIEALQKDISKEQLLISSIGTIFIIICVISIFYILHMKHDLAFMKHRNKNMLSMACILIVFIFIIKIAAHLSAFAPFLAFSLPIAAGAMIVCLFLGLDIAVPFAGVLAILVTIIFKDRFEIFLFYMLSATMGAYWMQHTRERKVFIKAGLKLGGVNILLITAIDIYTADYAGLKLMYDWIFVFIGGMLSGIITLGIVPLVEIAFDYTTDIKLLELANLDQPILRRLMLEAPGTYHHSVIVGTMVEAAASAIGANPLLARVCGYYHDIGKMKKPLYFIENQKDGKNKHVKLAPSMSSLILIAHIKGGVEIAKEHKLGDDIIDAIQQHHGTSLISYFYEKAKQKKGEDAVKIDDFRYPGPKPQTKEAGLVMLADVLEAASRTLENPTPARIQGLVHNLINKIFSDGQLDNCELTLKDLNNIAKSFNKILNAIYHHRIEYPDNIASSSGKLKNGSTDLKQSKQTKDTGEDSVKDSSGHLKRLGMS